MRSGIIKGAYERPPVDNPKNPDLDLLLLVPRRTGVAVDPSFHLTHSGAEVGASHSPSTPRRLASVTILLRHRCSRLSGLKWIR